MAEQKGTGSLILLEQQSLEQRSLHEIAKKSWNSLLEEDCVFILRECGPLIAHREKVLKNLSESLKNLPKLLKTKLINAVFFLQEGYSEAVIWEGKCKSALPFSIFEPADAGEYRINNFIDSSGHFNDLKWAKHFVDDETQTLLDRFIFACFYCFDKKIEYLWSTMKTNSKLPCDGKLVDIQLKYKTDNDLVVIWAYQLENKFDELIEESSYVNGFNLSGLFDAITAGHEYAARFFWSRCSESEKNDFLDNPEFSLLTDAAEGNHAGLVNFIYSLLNNDQKEELFSWSANDNSSISILCCLLVSQYYETVLKDLIKPSFPIPPTIYMRILISLSFEILELRSPLHKSIFKDLWNYLSEENRKEVLLGGSFIIRNLVKVKAMDLLQMIIQPLSHSEKDFMLLNNLRKAGITAVNDFSFGDHYVELRRYLLFFLTDYCPNSKKFSVRSDACSLFDKFIKSERFITFIETIPDIEEKNISEIIRELQDSLKVPQKLLEELNNTEN